MGMMRAKGKGRALMSKKGQTENWIRTRRGKGHPFPTKSEIAERFEITEGYAKMILAELKEELR